MAIVINDPNGGGNGGNGGDGGGSSSGGSSGGTSGQAARNYADALRAFLQSLGIRPTSNLNRLINQAGQKRWTQSTFLYYLRKTKEYKEAFPGIFNKDGTMKMSEQRYLGMVTQYKEIAGLFGLTLNKERLGALFTGDTSVGEYRVRAQAIRIIKDNHDAFVQFGKVLRARGVIKRQLKMKDLQDIVLGIADPKWYEVWREAELRTAAVEAGLNFGKGKGAQGDLAVPKGVMKTLLDAGLQGRALQDAVDALAQNFLETLPLSKIYGEDLSKKDIAIAIAGGKGSAQIRQRVERVLATEEAFNTEQRAIPQLVETEAGKTTLLGSKARKAQTQ